MAMPTIELHEGTCKRCGRKAVIGKVGCCLKCIIPVAKKLAQKMDMAKGALGMDADTALSLMHDANAIEIQLEKQDEEIARLKDLLKEAKELHDTLVLNLRQLVKRDTPLLDATT